MSSNNAVPVGVEVTLTRDELVWAATVGVERQAHDYARRRPDQAGFDSRNGEGWAVQCEGACGELAVARVLGLPWNPTVKDHNKGQDVGPYQVRTGRPDGRFLIIRPRDNDNKIYILVLGSAPTYRVVGWMKAGDAKQKRWLHRAGHANRPPAYFVPASELRPIQELIERN